MNKLVDLIKLFSIGLVIFAGGYMLVRYLETKDLSIDYEVSVEQEEELGELVEDMMWKKFPQVENDSVNAAIKVITDRLLASINTRYHYQFKVLQSEEINAFTIPGGKIYIFSGLIKAAESPEEVAAVIAHEIGHAEKRHVVHKIVKDLSLATVVSVLTGGDPGMVTQILEQILGTTFDREAEEEADDYGLELLEKSSIDPQSLATFFERLNEKDLTYNKNLEIIMTHPHNDNRIEKVKSYRTKQSFTARPIEMNWKRIKALAGEGEK